MRSTWKRAATCLAAAGLLVALNHPSPRPSPRRSPLQSSDPAAEAIILEGASEALQQQLDFDSSGIEITATASDELTLSGAVDSRRQDTLILKALRDVPGVHHIIDRIAVEISPSEYDVALESRINATISLDPTIGVQDVVEVDVNSGEVDIGGIVDTWAQHRNVTRDAFRAGAKTVVNHLRVRRDLARSEREFVYRAVG